MGGAGVVRVCDTCRMGDELESVEVVPARLVADDERERAIGWLRHHCGLGTLTLDEFGDRAGDVYAARSELDLWRALDGLPVPHTQAATRVPEAAVTPEASRRAGRRWHVAVFGGADRRGRWRIATSSVAIALFGGVDLDLRSVSLEDPDATEIDITGIAMFGGIDIIVPEGMEVETTGISLFGGKDCRLADVPPNPSLPVLRVRALVLFGGLDVRSRRLVADERRMKAAKAAAQEARKAAKKAARGLRHG
jgi:hypothetical protein